MTATGDQDAKAEYEAAIREYNEARKALNAEWTIGDRNPSQAAWRLLEAMDAPRNRLMAARDRYFGS